MNNMLFTTKMKKNIGLAIIGMIIALIGCFIYNDTDFDLRFSDMTINDFMGFVIGLVLLGVGIILTIMGLFLDKNYIEFYEDHIEGVASVRKNFFLKYEEIEKYTYKVSNFANLGVVTITSNGMDYIITIKHSAYSEVKGQLDGKRVTD